MKNMPLHPPVYIKAGSGMCTGGRVKHHLVNNISRSETTVLFVGYQAQGTLGRRIVNGDDQVRIHGKHYSVRAKIAQIYGFSAHADRDELFDWISPLQKPPKHLFITHGEKNASESFSRYMRDRLGWSTSVPKYKDEISLE